MLVYFSLSIKNIHVKDAKINFVNNFDFRDIGFDLSI